MNEQYEQPSLVVQAHCTQNLDVPSAEWPDAKPSETAFPGHDTFQNGVIANGTPTTFYTAATDKDIENILNHNSKMSGFLTDDSTLNACKSDSGILDANQYADMTQTRPWRPVDAPSGSDYSYRENVAAFDVNWDALNDPNNAFLKERLCDKNGNLKCAYGKAEENTHWGEGGGNQYYIKKSDFNEGVNKGIFEYNDNKSLKESDGSLTRTGVSEKDYKLMNAERKGIIDERLSSCQDKNASTDVEKAKSLNEMTPEKASQINTAKATDGDYLARPDPSYGYNHDSSAAGASAKGSNDQIAGQLPKESAAHENSAEIAGRLPVDCTSIPNNTASQFAGTTPDKKQDFAITTNGAEAADAGRDMDAGANKSTTNAVSAGIT